MSTKRIGNITGNDIFFAIRPLGAISFNVRYKEKQMTVWGIPLVGSTEELDIPRGGFENTEDGLAVDDFTNIGADVDPKTFKPEY